VTAPSISSALDDPQLLAPSFRGESWAVWRAILRAAEGLPLSDDQHRDFVRVAEREPPRRRVRELWAIAGRRSGKDSVASAIATVAALGDYSRHLRPGERASVLCLACDRQQARIVQRYIAGYFATLPLLKPLVARETDEGLELTNGVEVIVATNSFRSVRGRTIVCAIFDEAAFWRDEDSATPDLETYNAIVPGLVTLPGAMLIGISSPYRRSGLLFDRWRRYYGRPDDDVLVVKGPSTTFNPLLPQSVIDQALERDPEAAGAEWLAEFRSDLADYVDRAVVEAAVVSGRFELPPVRGVGYHAFVDPSGGSQDPMTLAVAHGDHTGRGMLDCIREVRPPFSPESVVEEFAAVLKSYGVSSVTGDRYAGEWPREQFRQRGIEYITSEKTKSDLYRELLPLLNGGKVELLENTRLVNQLCSLERRTARGGRDSIDHPRGLHDDIANSVGGALVQVAVATAPSLWRRDQVLRDGGAAVIPTGRVINVFATAAVDDIGRCAVCFWARTMPLPGQPWVLLLDYAVEPLSAQLFSSTLQRLIALTPQVGAQQTLGLYAEPGLVAHAQQYGLPGEELPQLPAPRDLSLAAAKHVHSGKVGIVAAALDKANYHPLGALLDAAGDFDDRLRIAGALGILLACCGTPDELKKAA
jgi:hypothetical protein